jgi:hypothetical protein
LPIRLVALKLKLELAIGFHCFYLRASFHFLLAGVEVGSGSDLADEHGGIGGRRPDFSDAWVGVEAADLLSMRACDYARERETTVYYIGGKRKVSVQYVLSRNVIINERIRCGKIFKGRPIFSF